MSQQTVFILFMFLVVLGSACGGRIGFRSDYGKQIGEGRNGVYGGPFVRIDGPLEPGEPDTEARDLVSGEISYAIVIQQQDYMTLVFGPGRLYGREPENDGQFYGTIQIGWEFGRGPHLHLATCGGWAGANHGALVFGCGRWSLTGREGGWWGFDGNVALSRLANIFLE